MSIYTHAWQNAKAQEFLDLVVILSTGCEEALKVAQVTHEPCCNELFAACKDDQIVLVSPSILYGLLRRKRDGKDIISECLDRITRNYAVFLNSDGDFVVLVPGSKSNSLKDLGFNESQLSRIEPDMFMQFAESRWASHLIEIEHFKNLFRQADPGYEPPAKHIYLISHGIDALDEIKNFKWSMPLIASLTIWQFVNFLQMLNAINTKFLHLASCYAAGCNFFNVERILSGNVEDERCIKAQTAIQFPIMIQGTTDSAVSAIIGDGPTCKNFFSVIHEWLENKNDGDMLSELLSKSMYNITHIAVAPNYPVLKLAGSVAEGLPVEGVQVVSLDRDIIPIASYAHYLFFYPSAMHKTTLAFESLTAVPHFISKVFGRACHFLGTIQVPHIQENNLVTLLEECFLKEIMRNHDGACSYGVSDKAWFIDSIMPDGQNNQSIAKGIVVQKGMLKYGIHKALMVYQDEQGDFHRIIASLPIEHLSVRNEIITENEYIQAVSRIFWETKADEEALSCSTCCSQSCFDVEQAFSEFFRHIDIPMPRLDAHAFIQEDFAQLQNRTLKKETYLNYVAHVHDCKILNELIESCINHSAVIDFNDIATILVHLIDMEQQDICLRLTRDLIERDDLTAKQAALDVLTYMVNVGLYVHASRVCDDVFACIDILALKQSLTGAEIGLVQDICNFFAQLIHTTVKAGQVQAADLIMSTMINHEQWYMYGLGLEVCIRLMKQNMCDISVPAQGRLQWFAQQIVKQRTNAALAVHFEQTHVIEEYRHLAYA